MINLFFEEIGGALPPLDPLGFFRIYWIRA